MKQENHSMDDRIEAILMKYREALMNDEKFCVLKQIREELKELLQMTSPSVEKDLPPGHV